MATGATRARRIARAVGGLLLLFAGISVGVVAAMRWIDPPTSAFMIRHALLGKSPPIHHWVDRDHISRWARLAVIASEDQNFPNHFGFDFSAIAEAIHEHREGEPLRGASTISQQTAKNLFLWPGRNFLRKGLEAWFTVLLELFWPKHRILEVYLNIAQFGPDTFGVEAAAEQFFHRSAGSLTRAQAALLAAVLPNPDDLHADSPTAYLRERQRWILSQMTHLGGATYLKGL